jgi:hypothetical protein
VDYRYGLALSGVLVAACGSPDSREHDPSNGSTSSGGSGGSANSGGSGGSSLGGSTSSGGSIAAGGSANPGGAANGGGGSGSGNGTSLTISPSSTTVLVGNSVTLSASVGGTAAAVSFAVVEGASCGAVTDAGVFTAPASVPDPAYCRVEATLVADPNVSASATLLIANAASGGEVGVWTQLMSPGNAQTTLVDPVRPSDFYVFVEGSPTIVLKSTDFGLTWSGNINTTSDFGGDPWGVAIDPDPERSPDVPPAMFSPAGFGSGGMWKSTDGGVTWADLLAETTVFDPYNPYNNTDVYAAYVLPDNLPNHLMFSYHYGFKSDEGVHVADAGFGESTDGGETWMVHLPPEGIGNSQYLIPLDSQNWLSISSRMDGDNGLWKTSTAGRVDGQISTAAWTKVDAHEHLHGGFQPYFDVDTGALYVPGFHGIRRTTDFGDTWTWAYENTSYMSSVVATDDYMYANYRNGPSLLRASKDDDTTWESYTETPGAMSEASPPYGVKASFDGEHWVLVMAASDAGVWRYVEP